RRAHDVPRPGPDRDQAEGLQPRRDRERRDADRLHDTRARHRVRHRRQGRRQHGRARAGGAAGGAARRGPSPTGEGRSMSAAEKPQKQGAAVTDYVAGFVTGTKAADIPKDVAHLGKRSVLDGIGLALAGAASETGAVTRRYLKALGFVAEGGSTVIGSDMVIPARFAAFANGISIHADDYDDTQLAVAKDRVYGLLTHPTAPALPPVLALAERDRSSGRDLLTAYQVGVEVECKIAEAILPRHYQ